MTLTTTNPPGAVTPPAFATPPESTPARADGACDAPAAPNAVPAGDEQQTPVGQNLPAAEVPSETAPPPGSTDQEELLRFLRQMLNQEQTKAPMTQSSPPIGEYNLVVEGLIKVRSDDGVLLSIPINSMLPGALSPAAIQNAQAQFEAVLTQLAMQPALMAFTAHLEKVQAKRNNLEQATMPKPPGTQYRLGPVPPATSYDKNSHSTTGPVHAG